jgi:hypothetical protein
MTAKRFKDLGFRLACIDALLVEGKLKRELARILKIPARDDYSEDVNPARLRAFRQIPLTQARLDRIKEFAPDGGDDIYSYVMEYWRGTQDELYVKSFRDIKLLTNLESLWAHAVVEKHSLDLTLLKANKKLKEVDTEYFILSTDIDIDEAVYDLESRGVSVNISGKP